MQKKSIRNIEKMHLMCDNIFYCCTKSNISSELSYLLVVFLHRATICNVLWISGEEQIEFVIKVG
jgi:hypothetical protein